LPYTLNADLIIGYDGNKHVTWGYFDTKNTLTQVAQWWIT